MKIVLDERYDAEQAIRDRDLGRSPFETLTRVARYYIDEYAGETKASIRKRMDKFLLRCDPSASLTRWSDALDKAVTRAFKRETVNIKALTVTKPELERIDAIDGKQVRRLAFVLLCLSKYWDEVSKNNNHWVNSEDNEIMQLANIKTSIRRQCAMYASLREHGMIEFSKKVDNTHVRVCFAEDGEPEMAITDLRNLGYQYLKRCGEPYFECVNCGVTARYSNPAKGKSQKYCKDCARDIRTQQMVNAAMRRKGAAAGA